MSVAPGGPSTAVRELAADLVQRAQRETEAGWMPLLEEATARLRAVEAERDALQRRHERFLQMATSTQRSDAAAIEAQRQTIVELQDQIQELLRQRNTRSAA